VLSDGGEDTVDGNAGGVAGVAASSGRKDNVTSPVCGVSAEGGGFVNVHGNVSVSGAGTFSAAAIGSGSTVLAGGDVTVPGTGSIGVVRM